MLSVLHHSSLSAAALLLAGACCAQTPSIVEHGTEVVLGRYSTQSAEPPLDAGEPLDVVAQLNFPRATVRTVGDAMQHTLLRTGYTLVDASELASEARLFLELPLPESQREIGPYRVTKVIDVLLGSTWRWHRDPLRRRLWFTVAPAYAALVQPPSPLAPVPAATAVPAVAIVAVPLPPIAQPAPVMAATLPRSEPYQREFP